MRSLSRAEAARRISLSKTIKLHVPVGRLRVAQTKLRENMEDPATTVVKEETRTSQCFDGSSAHPEIVGAFAGMDEIEERLRAEFKAGFDEGRRHAEKHIRDEFAAKHKMAQKDLENLIESIGFGMEQFQSSAERNVVRLAVAVAEKLVKREVALDDEYVLRQVHEAAKRIVGVERLKIRVNPKDEELLRKHRSSFMIRSDAVRELVIESDETIARGGCIIESDSGNVDALIATQMERIEAALLGSQDET